MPEKVHESGLMYVSRWYHHPDATKLLADPKLGGDLGFVKFLGVPGDGGTLSVTLAVRTQDAELRAGLADPDRFDLACRALPGPDRFFADGPLEPIGGVRLMGGLLNRRRTFLDDDGRPKVLGFHAIGDAHTCTNPLYGRGCSLAIAQAVMVADAYAAHPESPLERAKAYEQDCIRQVLPWYQNAVQMDRAGADPSGLSAATAAGVASRFQKRMSARPSTGSVAAAANSAATALPCSPPAAVAAERPDGSAPARSIWTAFWYQGSTWRMQSCS